MDDKSLKQLADLVDERINLALKPVINSVSGLETSLGGLETSLEEVKRIQQEHTEKLDALLVDVNQLQDESKLNKDEFQELHILKSDMKEVKERLGLTPTNQ